MMYVPGGDARKLAKLETFAPNSFIIDLEDAVALGAKADARLKVRSFLDAYEGGHQLWVRVNAIETGLIMEDIATVITPATAGLVVPKVESARTLHIVDWLVGEMERKAGLLLGSLKLMPLLETVVGLARINEIIEASQRTTCLAFGAGDYSRDIGIDWPQPNTVPNPLILAAKVRLVEASRAHGLLAPHDGVFPDIYDSDGLAKEASLAHELGFGGKHAIHPGQIERIRRCFSPSESQLNWAHKVVSAFAESEARGIASLHVDGRFVDYAVANRAKQVLASEPENPAG